MTAATPHLASSQVHLSTGTEREGTGTQHQYPPPGPECASPLSTPEGDKNALKGRLHVHLVLLDLTGLTGSTKVSLT